MTPPAIDCVMHRVSRTCPSPGMDFSVIIVSYNAAGHLGRCLESVFQQKKVSFEVFVVDNASEDGSCGLVSEHFPGTHLIANATNAGFAKANNQALKKAQGEIVYFLNPDTALGPGVLYRVKTYLSDHPEVGIAGTRIVNPDGSFQASVEMRYPGGRHGEKEMKALFATSGVSPAPVAWVLGASMAGRRSVLQGIGGFDERFFLYGEDADICLRVRKAGFEVGFIPEAVVVHWGGESERGHSRLSVWEKKIRAETLFFNKHYSKTTCRKIHREGLLQAYWRLLGIKAGMLFAKDKREERAEKYVKYLAVTRGYRWNP